MAGRRAVRVAANFRRNLDSVVTFLGEQGQTDAFDQLLNRLFDDVVPTLERFPDIGRDLLARRPDSAEAVLFHQRLHARLSPPATVRRYVFDAYLLLYLSAPEALTLLAIKHHRQLSYDLPDLLDDP